MASSKTLKIKRVFAFAIYNNLKNIPPKDYPTTGEIKSTIGVILPALKQHLTEYFEMVKKAEELSEKMQAKEISEAALKIKLEEYNDIWKKYNRKEGNELVDVSLEDEGFKVLKAQFERNDWGKKWVANIEEFGELTDAFEAASK